MVKLVYLYKTPILPFFISYANDHDGFRVSSIKVMNNKALEVIINHEEGFREILDKIGIKCDEYELLGNNKYIYPLHMQIELTDNCNLYCDYCYRNSNFKNKNSKFINVAALKKVLLTYKRKGLLELGITGGEPTLHNKFLDVMDFATKHFEMVELITNSTNLEIIKDLLETLNNDQKLKLNLSLSLNMWYRKYDDLKRYIEYKTIKEISKIHPVRVIATDYFYNTKKFKNLIKKLKEIGVKQVDCSYVAPIGRAKKKISENTYLKVYPIKEDGKEFTYNMLNCGLGLRHTTVDPDGNLRPCALFPVSSNFGNIFYDDLDDIVKILTRLYLIKYPSRDICGSCAYVPYCNGCIYRGIYNSNKNCNYRKFINKDYGLNKI